MREDIDYLDDNSEGNDFISLFRDVAAKVPVKKSILLFFVLVLVMNTVFIDLILSRIPGLVNMDVVTTRGTVVQIIIIILAYIVIDYVCNAEII